jgi:predicted kinase
MSKLELTPPIIIITMGYPGSGKTFFARQFSDTYSLPRISEEVIRYELFESPSFNNDESDILERVMFYALAELMKTGNSIICDAAFMKLAQRKRLYELATKAGYRTLTVWVQTDLVTSATRSSRRDKRSVDSKYSFNLDKSTFKYIVSNIEKPIEKENSIVISGKHPFKNQSIAVLKKITSTYSEALVNKTGVVNPLADPVKPSLSRSIKTKFVQ